MQHVNCIKTNSGSEMRDDFNDNDDDQCAIPRSQTKLMMDKHTPARKEWRGVRWGASY